MTIRVKPRQCQIPRIRLVIEHFPFPGVSSAQHVPGRDCSRVSEGLQEAAKFAPTDGWLSQWRDLVANEANADSFFSFVRRRRQLAWLTIDTTPACDLSCEFCYYNPNIANQNPQAPLAAITASVRDATRELKLHTLVLAGKEPTLNPQ